MTELQPYRIVKDGKIIDSKKYAGQAINAAKDAGAQEVFYLNGRNFGTTVWDASWYAPVEVDTTGYL